VGRVVASLRADGYTVHSSSYAAPVQLEGTLPTGENFYFRARFKNVGLRVWRDSPDPGSHWSDSFELAGEHSGSYLEPDEGEAILRTLVSAYLEKLPDASEGPWRGQRWPRE